MLLCRRVFCQGFLSNPARKHFSALVRVFLYLRATSDLSLSLGGLGPDTETISIATDASHEEGPSLTGVMVVMGAALIDWFSRRQKAAVRNSTAAEAVANADGSDHGVFIRELACKSQSVAPVLRSLRSLRERFLQHHNSVR